MRKHYSPKPWERQQPAPPPPPPSQPTETARERYLRLAQGRLTKTRKDIGLFANLKNQNLYESTDDDFLGIAQILFEETKRMLQMVGVPQEDFRRLMIRVAGGNLEG